MKYNNSFLPLTILTLLLIFFVFRAHSINSTLGSSLTSYTESQKIRQFFSEFNNRFILGHSFGAFSINQIWKMKNMQLFVIVQSLKHGNDEPNLWTKIGTWKITKQKLRSSTRIEFTLWKRREIKVGEWRVSKYIILAQMESLNFAFLWNFCTFWNWNLPN